MSDNKTMTTELRLKVVSDGLDKLSRELKNLGATDKQIEPLLKAMAGLQASSEVIQTLEKSGAVYTLKKYVDGLENEMNRLNKIKLPERPDMASFQEIRKPTKYAALKKYEKPFSQDEYLQEMRYSGEYNKLWQKQYGRVRSQYPAGVEAFDNVAKEKAYIAFQAELEKTLRKAQSFHNKQAEILRRHIDADDKAYKKRIDEFSKKMQNQIRQFDESLKIVNKYVAEVTNKISQRISTEGITAAESQHPQTRGTGYLDSDELAKARIAEQKDAERQQREQDIELKQKIEREERERKRQEELARRERERLERERQRQQEQAEKERKRQEAEELRNYKAQEKLAIQKLQVAPHKISGSDEELVGLAQAGNVAAVKEELELRKQLHEAVKVSIKEIEREVELAENKKEAEAALLKYKQAMQAESLTRQDIKVGEEQLKIAKEINKENEKQLQIEAQLEQVRKKTDSILEPIGQGKMKFVEIQIKVRELNAELAKVPKHLREAEATKLAEKLEKAGVHTKQIGGHLEIISKRGRSIEGYFARTLRDMFSLEKLVSRISFVITAKISYQMFDKIVAGFKSAIMTNIQFRDEMGKTFALIAGQSDMVKEKLVQDVIAIAGKYRVDLKEASEGIYTIISAQFEATDAVKVLDAAMKLAVGGFANLNDAALSLVQTLNAFELGAEKASHVADVMFETTRLGIITTQQYASEMSKVASTAAIFGISIEEVSAAISVMTRNGVKVSQAFTSLNQLLMTIANPTTQAKELMSSYGKELSISDVRAKGLVGTLMELQPLLQSEEDSTVIFKSRTGFKAMASLVQNADDYIDDLIAMYDSVGAAQDATNERLETTASLMKEVGITARNFGMTIGKSFEPTMRDIYRSLDDLMKTFIKIFPYLKSALAGLAVQIAAMKIPALFKAIGSGITTLRLSFMYAIDGIKNAVNGAAVSAKVAIAEATAGISLIIGLIIQVVSALSTAAKEAAKVRFDKAMGLQDAEEGLITLQGEIDNLNSKVASIDGILKLIEQTDELYGKTKDNIDLLGHWKKQHEAVSAAIFKILDQEMDKTIEAGKLGDWHNELIAVRLKNIQKAIMAELQFQQLSLGKDVSQMVKDAGFISSDGTKLYSRNIFQGFGHAIKSIFSKTETVETYNKMEDSFRNATATIYKLNQRLTNITETTARHGGHLSDVAIRELEDIIKQKNIAYDDFKSAQSLYADSKLIPSKGHEGISNVNQILLTIGATAESLIQSAKQAEIDIALTKAPPVPEIKRDGSGSTDKGGGTQKQIQDSVDQFISKFVAMFAKVGFEAETQFMRDIQDLLKDIEEYNKKTNTVKIGKEIINTLELTAGQIGQFAEFNELVSKRILDPSKILPNKAEIDKVVNAIKGSRADFQEAADALIKTGVPALMRVAEELMDDFDENLANAELIQYNYIEETAKKLISKAKTPKDALDIMEKILKESYPELFAKLAESSYEQIEELIESDDTPKVSQPYLKNVITERKKKLVEAIKTLVDDTAGVMKGLEKYMDSFQSLFDEVKIRLERAGLPTNRLSELVMALSRKDEKTALDILGELDTKGKLQETGEAKELVQAKQKLGEKIADREKFIKEAELFHGEYQNTISQNQAIISNLVPIIDRPEISGIDYDAVYDIIGAKLGRAYDTKKRKNESSKDFLWRILKNNMTWSGWGSFAGLETLDEKLAQIFTLKDFVGSERAKKKELPYISQERYIEYSPEDQQTIKDAQEKIDEAKLHLLLWENNMSVVQEAIEGFEKQIAEMPENVGDIRKFIIKELLEFAPEGYDTWSREAQQKWIYDIVGTPGEQPMSDFFEMLKRSRDRVGEDGEIIKGTGELGDFLKEHYDIKPMTIDEAWSMAQQKIMEVMTDAWKDYWQNQIKAAEEARDRLLKIEESREKMMLANTNLSSEQRARIQERYEERRRKIQEESERKLADIRKKQALSELTINFAKGIAEIWIRTLATKGAAMGIPEAAALTGLLTGIFAIQYAQMEKQTFAEGGYTGKSTLPRDRTGERPAGIVHEGELVIDRKTLDRNFHPLMSLYESLKNGMTFAQAISRQRAEYPGFGMNSAHNAQMRANGMYAGGGLVTRPAMTADEPINIAVDLNGVRVLDDVAISVLAEQGNRRRRIIRG